MGLSSLQWIGKGQVFNSGVRGELYQSVMRNSSNKYWDQISIGAIVAIVQLILFILFLCSIA